MLKIPLQFSVLVTKLMANLLTFLCGREKQGCTKVIHLFMKALPI